jgi:MFS family permease
VKFDDFPMNATERRATAGLAAIFSVRMLGLFLILPVFALYADHLPGRTPFLVGLAIGIYGLTQALLQIPFGMASDRFGRKPVIVSGLIIFAIGSVVAANATTLEGVIVGRALQGAGAIAAAIIALLADLTRENQRTKAMAIIGMSIGMSFLLALVLGPILYGVIGMPGIFWLTGGLALLAVAGVVLLVPTPVRHVPRSAPWQDLWHMARQPRLLFLDGGVFVLHAVLTASFVVVPTMLSVKVGLAAKDHWMMYLPVLLLSLFILVPLLFLAERRHQLQRVFPGAILLLAIAHVVIFVGQSNIIGLGIGMVLFFGAFNALEALMPSLVSRFAPSGNKGAAVGVYNTAQFTGVFAGGALGGILVGEFGAIGTIMLSVGALVLWLLVALNVKIDDRTEMRTVRVEVADDKEARQMAARLGAVPGVLEAVVVREERIAYLKVDRERLDQGALNHLAETL